MKNLKNLGKTLNKNEQQLILGGNPPPGFPDECIPGEEYLLPACNTEQQALADGGDPYWYCICGYASNGGLGGIKSWKIK